MVNVNAHFIGGFRGKKSKNNQCLSHQENEIAFVILVRYEYGERIAESVDISMRKIMIRRFMNKYTIAAIFLITVATALVALALETNLGEFVTAAFVISAMTCAITGIFVLAFSGGEPINPQLVGILPAQACINQCRIASDMGITGNAHFLPSQVTGVVQVMQFNPVSTYMGGSVSTQESFPKTGPAGLVTIPSCNPLVKTLRKRYSLVIPDNEEHLIQLLRETIVEIFEFTPRISARWYGDTITITFHHYRFIAGCQFIEQESPGCCTKNPCPACSLCGALIAEGVNKVIALEQCSVSPSTRNIDLVFLIINPERLPIDGGPGSSR